MKSASRRTIVVLAVAGVLVASVVLWGGPNAVLKLSDECARPFIALDQKHAGAPLAADESDLLRESITQCKSAAEWKLGFAAHHEFAQGATADEILAPWCGTGPFPACD